MRYSRNRRLEHGANNLLSSKHCRPTVRHFSCRCNNPPPKRLSDRRDCPNYPAVCEMAIVVKLVIGGAITLVFRLTALGVTNHRVLVLD